MFNYEKYLQSYVFTAVLPGSGEEITFRPLTTNDLKKVLIYENQQDPLIGEEILDQIITNVVQNENFNIDSIYIQDRYFLFIEIRKATKGKTHSFPHTCNSCGSQSIQSVDLDEDLDLKNMDLDSLQKELSVLNDNIVLEMGFVTRGEQKEGFKQIPKKLSMSQKQVEMMIADMASSIKTINTPDGKEEDLPVDKKMEFVGNLPGQEYDKIKEWHDNNYFGIDLTIDIVCPTCGHEEKRQLPLDNFFA